MLHHDSLYTYLLEELTFEWHESMLQIDTDMYTGTKNYGKMILTAE